MKREQYNAINFMKWKGWEPLMLSLVNIRNLALPHTYLAHLVQKIRCKTYLFRFLKVLYPQRMMHHLWQMPKHNWKKIKLSILFVIYHLYQIRWNNIFHEYGNSCDNEKKHGWNESILRHNNIWYNRKAILGDNSWLYYYIKSHISSITSHILCDGENGIFLS